VCQGCAPLSSAIKTDDFASHEDVAVAYLEGWEALGGATAGGAAGGDAQRGTRTGVAAAFGSAARRHRSSGPGSSKFNDSYVLSSDIISNISTYNEVITNKYDISRILI
jgi:hypothetical protein